MDGGPHVAGRRRAGDALSVARTHLMFSTPVIVDHVDGAEAMNAELLKLIEERRGLDEGVVRSNTGGWHSKQDFVNWSGEPGRKLLLHVLNLARDHTQIAADAGAAIDWAAEAWANVSGAGALNKAHVHGGAFWSAVYYVRAPESGSGQLVLHGPQDVRADAALQGRWSRAGRARQSQERHGRDVPELAVAQRRPVARRGRAGVDRLQCFRAYSRRSARPAGFRRLCRGEGQGEAQIEIEESLTMPNAEMLAKIARGDGFIAALDQSGGSTPKALKGYGVEDGAWSSDEEMFDLIHQMRSRIITSPSFASGKVIGAILFERTMDGTVAGKPTPQALIDLGIVPFIKIDKGLADEANGVQMMKPMPELTGLLERARQLGVFGTKERSVINLANRDGIAAVVAQQFDVAREVLAHDLVPIIEPEVNIKSPERDAADRILLNEILRNLDAISDGQRVMLKLSIPVQSGLFQPLIDHPKVLRVVALSGGFSREDACRALAKNPGMIASFSRALLSDLRAQQSDEEFDRTLGTAIDEIYEASTEKVPA